MKIAITGGIGSGKSTVRALIAQMGYLTLDADTVVRNLSTDSSYISQVQASFPAAITPSGEIDRKVLADLVFHNENHPFHAKTIFSFFFS